VLAAASKRHAQRSPDVAWRVSSRYTPAGGGLHLHRGADAHGRHGQVLHDEMFGAVVAVQQLRVLLWDLLEQLQHANGVQVVLPQKNESPTPPPRSTLS
jgi:hypothetical protein